MAITYHAGRRIQGLAPADATSTQYDTPVSAMTIYSSNGSTATHTTGEHFTATKWRNLELKSITVRQSRYNSSSSGSLLCQVFGSDHVTQIGSTITGTPSNASSLLISGGGYSSSTYTLVTYDLTGITSPNTEWFIAFGTLASGSAPAYVSYDTSNDGDGSNKWESYNGYSDQPSNHVSFELVYVGGDAKPTNVQVGSRWEETDTRKMYHYEDPITYTQLFEGSANTDITSTNTTYVNSNSTTSDQLYFDPRRSASNYTGTWDLGSTLSETSWVMRFPVNITSLDISGDTVRGFFGLSSHPSSEGASSNNISFIGCCAASTGSGEKWYRLSTRGNNLDVGETSNYALATGQIYIEIIRKTETTYSVRWTTNSDYSGGTIVNETVGSNGGSGSTSSMNLRYFWVGNINVSGNSDKHIQGNIPDVKIYNGVTSTDNVWSEEGT